MGFIYCITSPSGKQYVGQTTNSISKRFKEHACVDAGHRNLAIKKAFRKYGKDAMRIEVLVEVPDEELNLYERHFIKMLGAKTHGYNMTDGGEQPPLKDPEIAAKLKATLARPDVKKKLSDAQKRNHARPGAKEKRSAALKEAHARPETKAKFKAAWKKAQSNPEQREKNSRAQLVAQKRPDVNAKRSASLKATNQKDPSINIRRGKSGREANIRDPGINKRRSETLKRTLAAKKLAKLAHLKSGTTTSATVMQT
jgi:group I intron endonuclease